MADVPLIFPAIGSLYATLAPWAEMLLRVAVGLAFVPHGLRNTLAFFPNTGVRAQSIALLAEQLDRDGYRPGKLWAPLISATQLVAGPFLIVTNFERWRVGKYFWNQLGLEYTLMWTIAAMYFLVNGGGAYSLDRLLLGREF